MTEDTNTLTAGYESLGADINKTKGSSSNETMQGVSSDKLPELSLEMKDEEIVKLTEKWERKWTTSAAKAEWDKAGEENEKYWLGKQFMGPKVDGERAMVDNLLFESLETYLPQATRRNPDPLVKIAAGVEQTEVTDKYVRKVKDKLADLADKNRLRLKLKKSARYWAINLLGIVKYGWDLDRDIPVLKTVRPKKIILDPDATIDEDGYTGQYVGEHRKLDGSKILRMMENGGSTPEAIEELKKEIGKNTGTEVGFIEWWTAEYMCWQLKKTILLKKKNPNWNYDSTEEKMNVDDYGNETTSTEEVKGINHFEVPKIPFSFLSVFNLGDQPMDKTSLMGQNLSNQDLINKKNKQITKNTDAMNGGVVVSLERSGLDEAKARNVTKALQNGGTIVIPAGAPTEAVVRMPAPSLPADVFNQLSDTRSRLRDIFGTRGSSAGGIESESTVRGKIISRGLDTDRIGGGISEYLEQYADDIYNWLLQLLYVYDADFQFVPGAVPPKVDVSVKEGSLLPKDSTTIANQAIQLAESGKMATIDLYKRLEYPNPEELAANVWLETNAPELLYANEPRVAQALQMRAEAAGGGEKKPPSVSISFKDLPPDGQAQAAAQAGIQLDPTQLAVASAVEAEAKALPKTGGSPPAGGDAMSNVPIANA